MKSVNKVILIGHLGGKPEGRYTQQGVSTASFSLATNEVWVDSNKQKHEHTEWHHVVVWNQLADFVTEYLNKGHLIYLEGTIKTRSWKDKNTLNISFLLRKGCYATSLLREVCLFS